MRKQMSICVNGQTRVPPGFRFHPTEEELLQYYLKKRVGSEEIDLDVICEVDLNKLEPWDIQEKCKIGTSLQSEWYIFSHKDKKYPTGTRTNRATTAGFWKATGRDKVIYNKKGERIGMRKTLVFYKGRAPHGQKSDWIMHEYRLLDDHHSNYDAPFNDPTVSTISGESIQEEAGWVVCRIFKKKPHPIATANTRLSSSTATTDTTTTTLNSPLCNNAEGALNQIFRYMGATDAHRVMVAPVNGKNFMKLPRLGSPLKESAYYTPCFDNSADENDVVGVNTSHVEHDPVYDTETGFLSGVGWFMDNNVDSIFSTSTIHESQHQIRSTSSSWPAGENELEIMVRGGIK